MIRHDYDITSSLRRGRYNYGIQSQNALQALLPQIRAEIREEFRTSFGPSDAGGKPPPVTIHTWLKRFNKQKPHSFEKATAPVDAENWISHMEKIFDVMGWRMHLRLDWLCTSLRVMHLLGGKPKSKTRVVMHG
uniref:Zinc finger, CCHC-type, retrotransposon Gag domain protein n=1 Tax=Tanacetum cinerariifolium TaxID=118510 RepID=A0A699SHP2_TANCI|nr:zinc finger, CCHC-type, retrotransposon Gag domain protein [Tanacetum cinerariifolium]